MPLLFQSHTFGYGVKLGNKMLAAWAQLLRVLLMLVLFLTLLSPNPALAASPICNAELGWWESKDLQPLFTFNAPTKDCQFQQWAWTTFIHFMKKTGPQGSPLFLSLPTPEDLDNPSFSYEESGEVGAARELMLKPRFQKPGLALSRGGGEDLSAIGQAGSNGILVDQNSRVVYYSIHMNPPYFKFAKAHIGTENYSKTPPTETFPIDATVLKTAWMVVEDETKLPSDTFTTKATLQLIEEDPEHKGQLKISDKTQPGVTVALVGVHVVGTVKDHPEFLWATFEQKENSPDLPGGTSVGSNQQVSNRNFSFYKAGTLGSKSNQQPKSYSIDVATQKTKPITNTVRQFAHGGAEFSAESPTVSGQSRVEDIDSINLNMGQAIPAHSNLIDPAFAGYNLIGSVWIDTRQTPLKPGLNLFANSVGSITLASSTMETYVQGLGTNCFSCHNTQPFGTKLANKNIAISHIILGSLRTSQPTDPASSSQVMTTTRPEQPTVR